MSWTSSKKVACPRCELSSCGPEAWGKRLDGVVVERWRCGLCGYAIALVTRLRNYPSADRKPTDYIVMAQWEGINQWTHAA